MSCSFRKYVIGSNDLKMFTVRKRFNSPTINRIRRGGQIRYWLFITIYIIFIRAFMTPSTLTKSVFSLDNINVEKPIVFFRLFTLYKSFAEPRPPTLGWVPYDSIVT